MLRFSSGVRLGVLAGTTLLCSCLGIDALGRREAVTERDQGAVDPLADDRIEDKHPVFDPQSRVTEDIYPDCPATMNKSGSVVRLDVVPFADADRAAGDSLYPDFGAALAAFPQADLVPSMEVVNAELKAFNDGLYAAIELGVEDGSDGSLIDKRAVLRELEKELLLRSQNGTSTEQPLAAQAAAQVGAALQLGGGGTAAEPGAAALIASFDQDPLASRPIGFYTSTPALSAIFRQDRFLQSPASVRPPFPVFASAAVALASSASLAARYQKVLDLYAGLTNPFFDRSLAELATLTPSATVLDDASLESTFVAKFPRSVPGGCALATHAFLPASDSPENRLYRSLGCAPATNFLDQVVDAVRTGKLDLTPTASSGFYDRQLYALATLLVTDAAPEKDHLLLTRRYKQKLVDTFKAILIESRETHAKQLAIGAGQNISAPPPPPVDFIPSFEVEPFPTFYLRSARAYAFLAPLLRSLVGADFLATAHRVEVDGTRGTSALDQELHQKTALLYGLALLSGRTLGMKDLPTNEELAAYPDALEVATSFLAGWKSSADVRLDPRVIVPVSITDGMVHYWAVIGAKAVQVDASYVPGYEPQVESSCPFTGKWVARRPVLFSLESLDVMRPVTSAPLTRAELRALCDEKKTKDAIRAALEAP